MLGVTEQIAIVVVSVVGGSLVCLYVEHVWQRLLQWRRAFIDSRGVSDSQYGLSPSSDRRIYPPDRDICLNCRAVVIGENARLKPHEHKLTCYHYKHEDEPSPMLNIPAAQLKHSSAPLGPGVIIKKRQQRVCHYCNTSMPVPTHTEDIVYEPKYFGHNREKGHYHIACKEAHDDKHMRDRLEKKRRARNSSYEPDPDGNIYIDGTEHWL